MAMKRLRTAEIQISYELLQHLKKKPDNQLSKLKHKIDEMCEALPFPHLRLAICDIIRAVSDILALGATNDTRVSSSVAHLGQHFSSCLLATNKCIA